MKLSEQCFWTLNNFLLNEKHYAEQMVKLGLCKGITVSLQIKEKVPEFLAEVFWTLNYLLDLNQMTAFEVLF